MYLLLCDEWIGKPRDNVFSLKDCYTKEDTLILDFGDGWIIECSENIKYLESDKELTISSNKIILTVNGKALESAFHASVKFFID